jgi:hypothetical protein
MLPAKAQEIAATLEHWEVNPDYVHATVVQLRRPDLPEAVLYLRGRRGRIEITGQFPPQHFPAQPPRITVSQKRSGAAIAADIKRRFLPDYFPALSVALERARAAEREAAAANAALETLATALGERVTQPATPDREGYLTHYGSHGRLKVRTLHGGQFAVEIQITADLETILQFCDLVR